LDFAPSLVAAQKFPVLLRVPCGSVTQLVDRFAANTLRTLGIILTSMFVILGCLILLVAALCFGALAKSGTPSDQSQASAIALVAFLAAVLLISIGVSIIAALAKGMVRGPSQLSPPYPLIPPPTPKPSTLPRPSTPETPRPASDEAKLDQALASFEAMTRRTSPASPPPIPERAEVAPPLSRSVRQGGDLTAPAPIAPRITAPPRPVDVRHLSPASRTAIQQLAYAIVAKVAVEVALGIVGWYGALGVPRFFRVPFPVYRFGFIAWGLAAIAPHLVLLYALARRPGPRAFAYALVIPSLHLLFGIFGHSAFLAFVLRAGQIATPLLSIAPWLIDILILYLAWKAIRLTGIEPPPSRFIVASVVILLYTSLLPPLVLFLNYVQMSRGAHPLP